MHDLTKLRRQRNSITNHTELGISHTYSRAYKETYLPGVDIFLIRVVLGHVVGASILLVSYVHAEKV